MNIILNKNEKEWDLGLKSTKNPPFTQSSAWADVLVKDGEKVEKLEYKEKGTQALAVYKKLPFGMKYAFCPAGPISQRKEDLNLVLKDLSFYLKEKGFAFFRVEPQQEFNLKDFEVLKSIDITPRATTYLDLEKDEEELLKNMHSKTRYNIRLAKRKGVEIVKEKDFETFFNLMEKTGERDKFRLHSKEHYKNVLDQENVFTFFAKKDGNIIASAVFLGFGDTFTYLYGASDYNYRNLMAPYLLQWEGIKLGKSLGYKYYDFFGIAPRKEIQEDKKDKYNYDPDHQYGGVTRFKLGFGGSTKETPGTFDIILDNKKYFLYNLLRRLRRLI